MKCMKKKNGRYQAKERRHFDSLVQATGDVYWGNLTPAGTERFRRKAQSVAQHLAVDAGQMVLELGCGAGAFSEHVLAQLPYLDLVGCDISPEAVASASARCAPYTHAAFAVGDAIHLPFANETFDAIVGNAILHHLPIEPALSECFRVLKPSASIWFSEPNMMNPQIAVEKNVRFIGRMLQNTEDETAFFRWSLARTIRNAGFDEVSVQPLDFLHPAVPRRLIRVVDLLGRLVERIPLVREVGGNLLILACKAKGTDLASRCTETRN